MEETEEDSQAKPETQRKLCWDLSPGRGLGLNPQVWLKPLWAHTHFSCLSRTLYLHILKVPHPSESAAVRSRGGDVATSDHFWCGGKRLSLRRLLRGVQKKTIIGRSVTEIVEKNQPSLSWRLITTFPIKTQHWQYMGGEGMGGVEGLQPEAISYTPPS